jgi:hypothetical protein
MFVCCPRKALIDVIRNSAAKTTCCGRWSMRDYARTSRRPRFAARCRRRNPERRAALSPRQNQSPAAGASPLSHNQLVARDVDPRPRRRSGVSIVHRRRARLHNERPQLSKVLTPIVKIREAIPPQESFAGPIPFAPHGTAKSRPQPGILLAILLVTNAPRCARRRRTERASPALGAPVRTVPRHAAGPC